MPNPGRGGQRPGHTRSRRDPESTPRDLSHTGYIMQRRGRGGVLLRVGAGFAELFLGRDRGGGQAVPDFGERLHANRDRGPKTKAPDADGGPQPGGETGAGGEKDKRVV